MQPMLELDRVSKAYATPAGKVRAVDRVSLTVKHGEMVALFGPSGSGKTTLLHLAAGLLRCDAGYVRFEGRDIGALSKSELLGYRRQSLGFVFQNFNLVPGLSAEENVVLPLLLRGAPHRQAHTQARTVLDRVGLSHRASHPPAKMSGGEQQRTAIARALVGQPALVLADEPTGNLDSETGDAILTLLNGLVRERAAGMIVVTHDTRVATYADRVDAIRDGALSSFEPTTAEVGL